MPPQTGYEWEIAPTPRPEAATEPEPTASWAESLAEQEIWRVLPSRHKPGGTLAPLSPEWFAYLEKKRYRRQGEWITDLFNPNRAAAENVVAVGDGMGTDWVRLSSPVTRVSVVEPNSDRLWLNQKHFAARGTDIPLLHAPWDHLPFGDDRTDVAVLFFHRTPAGDFPALVREAFRILRPGGKIVAVVPGKFNAARWQDMAMPWRWGRSRAANSDLFTSAGFRKNFDDFENVSVRKRHLRRSELPYLWRWLPLPLLERLMGRFLVLKAFKPLSQSPILRIAA